MEMIRFCKWTVWIAISLLLSLMSCTVFAQPGFISIDCGGETNFTDENGIKWATDANYIDVGQIANMENANLGSYFQRQRIFPKPLNKSCYQLPVAPSVPYLLRLWFAQGNSSVIQTSFTFSTETVGMLHMEKVTITGQDPFYFEEIFISSGRVLYVCLIRDLENDNLFTGNYVTDDPFINAIELRTLRDGMYEQAKPGTMLGLLLRNDFGGHGSMVRYPQDNFDRIWTSPTSSDLDSSNLVLNVSSQELISSSNTKSLPPTAVMQTAWVMNKDSFQTTTTSLTTDSGKLLLLLYFAELETQNISGSRSFYVSINGETRPGKITTVPNYSAQEIPIPLDESIYMFGLQEAPNSTRRPIINAGELYSLHDTDLPTYSQDVEVLNDIKTGLDIKDWISDPCYVLPWEGIGCDSTMRISEIKLSGRNLIGSVPDQIGQLTALVNLSLDNNHLIGPLPDLSNLTMLKTLHLQNNNLSGSIPDWLSELENLTELFIENNYFSGVIPSELLNKRSLNFKFSGNPDLCMSEGECIQPKHLCTGEGECIQPKHKTKKNLLGLKISGCLIIAVALMVGIAVYWKKLRAKQNSNEDPLMLTMGPTESHAFTLKEMREATNNFSQKIGDGGYGSVFFGKLPEGKEIAVKRLTVFSQQGVEQFRNEIRILPKVNHKNVLSLLGYCNESRELMLIYEHMSGGSLWDRFYGPKAEASNLNWKTRLNIALDVANGLEYLHVACTPKIIHRDVKTANILLDGNLTGKLADFGISKLTVDGEASHATTLVKGTRGHIDPEYERTHNLTDKSDVYSFGVVLFEIICGRAASKKFDLLQWVTPYAENGIVEIIDQRLGGNYNMKSITAVARLALRCVEATSICRPSISEVVAEIKDALIHEYANTLEIRIGEGIGNEYGDLQPGLVRSVAESSTPKKSQWDDNSSQIP